MEAAAGRPVWAMGLMSGTSMDGVDAALVLTDGERVSDFGDSVFLDYDERYRAEMAAANRAAPGVPTAALKAPADWPEAFAALHRSAVVLHAEAVGRLGAGDVVGFHGQTVAHRPAEGVTLQLGDGAELARRTGRATVWDFRSADMAAGGEGAPLAPFYHFALARRMRTGERLAFLNLGGVANVTLVDPDAERPEDTGALMAFDTGPGNAPIDDLMLARTGARADFGGAAARAGRVDEALLGRLLAHPYFARPAPKSADRNDFPLPEGFGALPTEDAAATLTEFTAAAVARAVAAMPEPPARWLVCGGGRKNAFLMERLGARLEQPVADIDSEGIDGDMVEAQAFAHLAVRVLRGLPTSAPGTTGCRAPVCGGRVSRPGAD